MKIIITPVLTGFLLTLVSVSAPAADPAAAAHWFYMVKTRSTDPAQEAEFNAWYDDIDIPDVLDVPGFMRARRGQQQSIAEFPQLDLRETEGKYVALYDIETADIDKTIIDLYVGARKMVALGRITDLLKVTEANYYRRLTSGPQPAERTTGGNDYVYIRKVLCCADDDRMRQFLDWLEGSYVPEITGIKGINGVKAYELYRIMEVVSVGPEEIPHLLLVHEITTGSIIQAVVEIHEAVNKLDQAGRMSGLFVEGNDSAVYLQMSDVKAGSPVSHSD